MITTSTLSPIRRNIMDKTAPLFWSRWFIFLSLFLILYGLAMALAPQPMNDTLVAPLLYHSEPYRTAFASLDEPAQTFLNVINGLLGAVTIPFAILIGWIAYQPFPKGERWAWNALAMSMVAWAAVEAYVKFAHGLGIRSMAHVGLLLAFAIPLALTYRHFYSTQPCEVSEPSQG
jgi:hypothetical protein